MKQKIQNLTAGLLILALNLLAPISAFAASNPQIGHHPPPIEPIQYSTPAPCQTNPKFTNVEPKYSAKATNLDVYLPKAYRSRPAAPNVVKAFRYYDDVLTLEAKTLKKLSPNNTVKLANLDKNAKKSVEAYYDAAQDYSKSYRTMLLQGTALLDVLCQSNNGSLYLAQLQKNINTYESSKQAVKDYRAKTVKLRPAATRDFNKYKKFVKKYKKFDDGVGLLSDPNF